MRVLLLQSAYETSKDLSGLSLWSHHLDIIRSLARQKARVFFYIPVPERTEGIRYDDSLFDLPNVRVLPYKHRGYYLMPDEWLKWLSVDRNLVPFDVVWSDPWWLNTVIAVTVGSSVSADPPALVNTFYESPRAPELIAHKGMPLVDLAMIGGGLQDHTVLLTEYHRRLFFDIARQYVSGNVLRVLEDRVDVLPPAVDVSLIDKHRKRFDQERAERKELVVFAAGGLVESKRRFPDIAKVVKKLRELGYPIRMKVRTQSPSTKARGAQLEELGVEIEYECTRQKYLERLGDADVVVDATTDETTGLANIEAVLSGAQYIALVQPWMQGRLPSNYPMAVPNWDAVQGFLAAMARDKWCFQGAQVPLELHYRQMFDSDRVAEKFMAVAGRASRGGPFRVSKSTLELVVAAAEGRERLTLTELYEGMRRHALNPSVDWARGSKFWNSLVARRAMAQLGYVDTCETVVAFEKVAG